MENPTKMDDFLGGGFKSFLCSVLFGEDDPNLIHIFQRGWFNHQPDFGLKQNPIWMAPQKRGGEEKTI